MRRDIIWEQNLRSFATTFCFFLLINKFWILITKRFILDKFSKIPLEKKKQKGIISTKLDGLLNSIHSQNDRFNQNSLMVKLLKAIVTKRDGIGDNISSIRHSNIHIPPTVRYVLTTILQDIHQWSSLIRSSILFCYIAVKYAVSTLSSHTCQNLSVNFD